MALTPRMASDTVVISLGGASDRNKKEVVDDG